MHVDKFGHCIKCGRNLITEKVIELEVKKVLTPEYDQIQFVLEDDSKMRVVICKPCKEILEEKDYKDLMKSVIAGWKKEVKDLPHWNAKKKEDYMKVYGKKKIKHKVKEFKYGSHK